MGLRSVVKHIVAMPLQERICREQQNLACAYTIALCFFVLGGVLGGMGSDHEAIEITM